MSTFRLGVVGGTSAKIDGCKLSLELTVSFRIVMREISHRANIVMYRALRSEGFLSNIVCLVSLLICTSHRPPSHAILRENEKCIQF